MIQGGDPWVKAIIGLWDDPAWYAERSRRSAAEARRWAPEVVERMYSRLGGLMSTFDSIATRGPAGR